MVERYGAYAPFAEAGAVVVDVASNYMVLLVVLADWALRVR